MDKMKNVEKAMNEALDKLISAEARMPRKEYTTIGYARAEEILDTNLARAFGQAIVELKMSSLSHFEDEVMIQLKAYVLTGGELLKLLKIAAGLEDGS